MGKEDKMRMLQELPKTLTEEGQETILVIDDEEVVLKMLRSTFEREGFRVLTAAESRRGVEFIEETKVDLVLLDIRMPGLDGYEVARLIRQKSKVPIIMVTGNVNAASLSKAFDVNVNGYVAKPFSPAELVARARKQLSDHHS